MSELFRQVEPVRPRRVEVAVDVAAAAGVDSFSYHVPAELEPLEAGEAVLVEFGRRQVIGIVLGPSSASIDRATKPILDRVRSDGPLLPPLTLELAGWISTHYLASPATVLRAMLPPGLMERLELVAELRPGAANRADLAPAEQDLVEQLGAGPRATRNLITTEGRVSLVRRLRRLATSGVIDLDWTLLAASAGPRWERVLRLTDAGRAAASVAPGGSRPLGPRQRAVLAFVGAAGSGGAAAAPLGREHGAAPIASLARRGLIEIELRERPRRPLAGRAPGARGARPVGTALSGPQSAAIELIREAIARRDPRPLLLDGITGGGKTAVYVEALAAALAIGRPGLVLVPEIALAAPLIDRLRADLTAEVALVHSGLSDGERADEWRRIRARGVDVVVGTRTALLSPLAEVGLIIVDEEHDAAYKSDRTPRVQARDAAIRLAALAGAAVVLGSASPAVDSFARAADRTYRHVRLPSRPSGGPPAVEVVDLREELAAGNRGLLSDALATALASLDATTGEQAILVINRRGSASVVLCRDCGHVQACRECTRPLVYHQAGGTLRCHHCGRAWPLATRCPGCGSARIRYLGGGTERLEREVRERLPGLRTGRLDRDVASRRGAAERLVDAFAEGRLDVLVGTSLVTKGLDIGSVTLVGVVSADVALNLPDERAAERTYQLLVQAVGRAGRGERPGRAIIQTYLPDHPAIRAVAARDPAAFYAAELELRRRFGSPPFGDIVKLTVALEDRAAAEREAEAMADRLRAKALTSGASVTIAGPAPAYVARRAERWRYNVVLRGADPASLVERPIVAPWTVDVDPESLL